MTACKCVDTPTEGETQTVYFNKRKYFPFSHNLAASDVFNHARKGTS